VVDYVRLNEQMFGARAGGKQREVVDAEEEAEDEDYDPDKETRPGNSP
jgi:hypothetical protein